MKVLNFPQFWAGIVFHCVLLASGRASEDVNPGARVQVATVGIRAESNNHHNKPYLIIKRVARYDSS